MDDRVLVGVAKAIAEVEEVAPSELDRALENFIDMDSLEGLAGHESNSWAVSFETPDHLVTVTGSGWVLVDNERILRWDSSENGGDESFLRSSSAITGD